MADMYEQYLGEGYEFEDSDTWMNELILNAWNEHHPNGTDGTGSTSLPGEEYHAGVNGPEVCGELSSAGVRVTAQSVEVCGEVSDPAEIQIVKEIAPPLNVNVVNELGPAKTIWGLYENLELAARYVPKKGLDAPAQGFADFIRMLTPVHTLLMDLYFCKSILSYVIRRHKDSWRVPDVYNPVFQYTFDLITLNQVIMDDIRWMADIRKFLTNIKNRPWRENYPSTFKGSYISALHLSCQITELQSRLATG